MTDYQKEQIVILRNGGMSLRDIAAKLNVSKSGVAKFLQRMEEGRCICPMCKSVFTQTPKRKPRKFCSNNCRYKYNRMKRGIVFTCKQCGRTFTDLNHLHRSFCSHKCYVTYMKDETRRQNQN